MENSDRFCRMCRLQINHEILQFTAEKGHVQCLKYAIKMGGLGVNRKNIYRNTALVEAAQKGQLECMKILLAIGADVNICDRHGRTPLQIATQQNYTECARILTSAEAAEAHVNMCCYGWNTGAGVNTGASVNRGSDVNMKPTGSMGSDMLTAEERDIDTSNALAENGMNIDAMYEDGYTALFYAAKNGRSRCVERLIQLGADVNKCGQWGGSALVIAASKGHTNCLEVLLGSGADVNLRDNLGVSALMAAVTSNKTDCVKLLVEAGANLRDEEKYRSVRVALDRSNEECLRSLIQAGADVNHVDNNGMSFLRQEANYGKLKNMKILLRNNVKINSRTRYSFSLTVMHMLDYAAGEQARCFNVPHPSFPPHSVAASLKQMCREAIRKHLLDVDPHSNLFYRIPQLGLSPTASRYLLYGISVEEKEEEPEICLNDICREFIVEHLRHLHPEANLYCAIRKLPLPTALTKYLIWNTQLRVDEDEQDYAPSQSCTTQ